MAFREFVDLFEALDGTQKTGDKTSLLARYFSVSAQDRLWALYFLLGGKISRLATPKELRDWVREISGLPEWMVNECYDLVGDLAETLARLLPDGEGEISPSLDLLINNLLSSKGSPIEERKTLITNLWRAMSARERLVFNKILTGAFRVGAARGLVFKALSQAYGLPVATVTEKLTGPWTPQTSTIDALIRGEGPSRSQPYPFALAHPLEGPPEDLGDPQEWAAEWKWDGIRAQVIRREDSVFIWSRGEESVGSSFPEVSAWGESLPPGTVLDGEIVAWSEDAALPFTALQRRVGKKSPKAALRQEIPCVFIAYDILELGGRDVRPQAFVQRRTLLEETVSSTSTMALEGRDTGLLSALLPFETWTELAELRETSRERSVEGVMLKRSSSPYPTGRTRGVWWKWKIAPYTVDAVLLYAQRGHGKRAGLYTDYTFGLWHQGALVPVAKAYSGLTNDEITKVDKFIQENKRERFGPVVSVDPKLVFELAFEGGQLSTRHKSGIALRFPRILRIREDKKPEEADTVDGLRHLLGI